MLSTVVRLGLLAVGLGLVLDRTRTLLSDVQLTWGERVVMGIAVVAYGGGFALAGWVADRVLRAAAELIGLMGRLNSEWDSIRDQWRGAVPQLTAADNWEKFFGA